MGFGAAGRALGVAGLLIAVPPWLTSAVPILACVPKGKLITGGPFALMLHPLYTSVALPRSAEDGGLTPPGPHPHC
jgi:hypothetical protein